MGRAKRRHGHVRKMEPGRSAIQAPANECLQPARVDGRRPGRRRRIEFAVGAEEIAPLEARWALRAGDAGLPFASPVPAHRQHPFQQVGARIPDASPDLEVARSSAFHPVSLQHARRECEQGRGLAGRKDHLGTVPGMDRCPVGACVVGAKRVRRRRGWRAVPVRTRRDGEHWLLAVVLPVPPIYLIRGASRTPTGPPALVMAPSSL